MKRCKTRSSLFITDSPSEYNNMIVEEVLTELSSLKIVQDCDHLDLTKGKVDLVVIDDGVVSDLPTLIRSILEGNPEVKIVVLYTILHWKIAKSIIQLGAEYFYRLEGRDELLSKFRDIFGSESDSNH
jgi:hypothetical protein